MILECSWHVYLLVTHFDDLAWCTSRLHQLYLHPLSRHVAPCRALASRFSSNEAFDPNYLGTSLSQHSSQSIAESWELGIPTCFVASKIITLGTASRHCVYWCVSQPAFSVWSGEQFDPVRFSSLVFPHRPLVFEPAKPKNATDPIRAVQYWVHIGSNPNGRYEGVIQCGVPQDSYLGW